MTDKQKSGSILLSVSNVVLVMILGAFAYYWGQLNNRDRYKILTVKQRFTLPGSLESQESEANLLLDAQEGRIWKQVMIENRFVWQQQSVLSYSEMGSGKSPVDIGDFLDKIRKQAVEQK